MAIFALDVRYYWFHSTWTIWWSTTKKRQQLQTHREISDKHFLIINWKLLWSTIFFNLITKTGTIWRIDHSQIKKNGQQLLQEWFTGTLISVNKKNISCNENNCLYSSDAIFSWSRSTFYNSFQNWIEFILCKILKKKKKKTMMMYFFVSRSSFDI